MNTKKILKITGLSALIISASCTMVGIGINEAAYLMEKYSSSRSSCKDAKARIEFYEKEKYNPLGWLAGDYGHRRALEELYPGDCVDK